MSDPKLEAAIDAYDEARRRMFGEHFAPMTVPGRENMRVLLGAAVAQYLGMLGEVEFVDADTGAVRHGVLI